MAEKTEISWCDHTWSPVWGCTQISKAETGGGGCDNCYAMTLAHRFGYGWNGEPMREFGEHHWNQPLRWNEKARAAGRQQTVFPSMCDPFDKDWPAGMRKRFFSLILHTPNLNWLLLTKRIGNAHRMLSEVRREVDFETERGLWLWLKAWENNEETPSNVWMGATVVNQEEADRDIPKLLCTPARIRFLSIEPMLGPITIPEVFLKKLNCDGPKDWPDNAGIVDWGIVGAESGTHARPLRLDWVRSIVQQFKAAGVAAHVKQLGHTVRWNGIDESQWPAGVRFGGDLGDGTFQVNLQHKKGGDLAEWPADLRIQDFPNLSIHV